MVGKRVAGNGLRSGIEKDCRRPPRRRRRIVAKTHMGAHDGALRQRHQRGGQSRRVGAGKARRLRRQQSLHIPFMRLRGGADRVCCGLMLRRRLDEGAATEWQPCRWSGVTAV